MGGARTAPDDDMANFSDSNRLLKLTTPLGADKLLVLGFTGHERVGGLFEFVLDLIAPRDDFPDVTKLIGKGATLSVNFARQNAFEAEGQRVIHGIISQFGEVGQLQANSGNQAFD